VRKSELSGEVDAPRSIPGELANGLPFCCTASELRCDEPHAGMLRGGLPVHKRDDEVGEWQRQSCVRPHRLHRCPICAVPLLPLVALPP
jgi:hypothetical protein